LVAASTTVVNVRSVAPGKDMYCCTFPLPLGIATAAEAAHTTL